MAGSVDLLSFSFGFSFSFSFSFGGAGRAGAAAAIGAAAVAGGAVGSPPEVTRVAMVVAKTTDATSRPRSSRERAVGRSSDDAAAARGGTKASRSEVPGRDAACSQN